jgi:hypothetical protein
MALPLFPDVPNVDPQQVSFSTPYAKGSDTSKAAAIQAQTFSAAQRRDVFAWIQRQGEHGGTQKECHDATGIERASLCPRFLELVTAKAIVKTDERRGGCFVYRAVKG